MAKAKSNSSQDDHNTLEDNKGDLVLDQVTIVTILELDNTEDTSSKNEDNGSGETNEESVDAPAKSRAITRAPVSEHVVGKGSNECSQDNDLKDQTSHGDVDTKVAVVIAGGQGTTGSLENEADDIERNENPVEELGLESRELRGKEDDGLGKSDVDRGRVEDGGNGQADNLNHEGVEREWVVIHHDTANISDNFAEAASDHTKHEAPSLPPDTDDEVDEAEETKESGKGDISGKRRSVGVDTPLNVTGIEIAGRVSAEGVRGPNRVSGCGRHFGGVASVAC